MYKFIDVNEASENTLPSEALCINGSYIENMIEGYRTLSVAGREALSPELSHYTTGVRDGSMLKNKRYPARTITVRYQLLADSTEAFRAAYNKLGQILNVEEAELIFNDEKDKFFIGTPSSISRVDPGTNYVVGEFDLFCADPFKYSVEEYEVEAENVEESDEAGNTFTGKAVVIDYNGTYRSYPTLVTEFYNEAEISDDGNETPLTGAGDCGFVAYLTEDGKVIQLGDPEELDGVNDRPESQTLVNQVFKSSRAWGETAKAKWITNAAVEMPYKETQTGSLKMWYSGDGGVEQYLTVDNYGSGGERYGPSITRELPADESGEVGASNFTISFANKMGTSAGTNGKYEVGIFHAYLAGDGVILAGIRIAKYCGGNNAGKINYIVNGELVGETAVDLGYNNEAFGKGYTSVIKKIGNEVTFYVGGVKKSYRCYAAGFSKLKATTVSFAFSRYQSAEPLKYNGLYSVKFVKHNCDTYRDVPNKFSANDILVADCEGGEIMLNGVDSPELGALGNDWESFCLAPGLNRIGIAYSDWITEDYAPKFKLRYREVFL